MLNPTPDAKNVASSESSGPSLRALFEREESKLLRYAFALTGRREVAEEIVQEVFLQLHARWGEISEAEAWLARSVRNRAFHHWRKMRRETLRDDEPSNTVGSEEETPDERIVRLETMAELRRLVGQLPEKDQKLIHLKYFEGLKYRDISQRTGLTISNVGFRLNQILKKLAASLLPKGIEDAP